VTWWPIPDRTIFDLDLYDRKSYGVRAKIMR